MQITLLRHGKPDFKWKRSIKGSEFSHIECEYDSANIIGSPPEESLHLVKEALINLGVFWPRQISRIKACELRMLIAL